MSGERSLDMFASDIASAKGGIHQPQMSLIEGEVMRKSPLRSKSVSAEAKNEHQRKQTLKFSESGFDLVDRIYKDTSGRGNLSL